MLDFLKGDRASRVMWYSTTVMLSLIHISYGAIAEYDDKSISARYGVALMPKIANDIDLDWDLRRASGQNMEVEWRHGLLGPLLNPDRKGVVRVLSYVNHAHMGLYRAANKAYLAGTDSTPDITKHETCLLYTSRCV